MNVVFRRLSLTPNDEVIEKKVNASASNMAVTLKAPSAKEGLETKSINNVNI